MPSLDIFFVQQLLNGRLANGGPQKLVKGTKIDSVLIQYTGSSGTFFVGDCANPTTPRSDGKPCIAKRIFYRSSRVPGWTPDLDGDFEWQLISTANGSYKVF